MEWNKLRKLLLRLVQMLGLLSLQGIGLWNGLPFGLVLMLARLLPRLVEMLGLLSLEGIGLWNGLPCGLVLMLARQLLAWGLGKGLEMEPWQILVLGPMMMLVAGLSVGLSVGLVQWLKLLPLMNPYNQDQFIRQWISKFPEDWHADLDSLRQRWFKRGYSNQKIKYLTLWYLFHMILADVKIKIDNLLLFNYKIK